MRGIQHAVDTKRQSTNTTKGVWEVILTDPSLNKFTFGPTLISRYVMTDIISPYGQKSILYTTIPSKKENELTVSLNFENIDDGSISDILIRASKPFYKKWNVVLVDTRTNMETVINEDEEYLVEPPINYNKLFAMGFIQENEKNGDSFFHLKLRLK